MSSPLPHSPSCKLGQLVPSPSQDPSSSRLAALRQQLAQFLAVVDHSLSVTVPSSARRRPSVELRVELLSELPVSSVQPPSLHSRFLFAANLLRGFTVTVVKRHGTALVGRLQSGAGLSGLGGLRTGRTTGSSGVPRVLHRGPSTVPRVRRSICRLGPFVGRTGDGDGSSFTGDGEVSRTGL